MKIDSNDFSFIYCLNFVRKYSFRLANVIVTVERVR